MEMDAITSLDQSVQTWSDYNRIYYHPRSMNQVTTHHMDDTINPFDAYTVGRQSFSDYERVSQPRLCWIPSIFDSHIFYLQETESYEDNFRHFAEECDNLQVWEWESNVIKNYSFIHLQRDSKSWPVWMMHSAVLPKACYNFYARISQKHPSWPMAFNHRICQWRRWATFQALTKWCWCSYAYL